MKMNKWILGVALAIPMVAYAAVNGVFANISASGTVTAIGGFIGNATSATALVATPTQCSTGTVATGIAANGNANCGPGVTGTGLVDVTGSRTLGTVFHNTGTSALSVSGNSTITGGSGDSFISCLVGSTSTPTSTIWQTTAAFTVTGEPVGFACIVPAGYFYEIAFVHNIATVPDEWWEMPLQ